MSDAMDRELQDLLERVRTAPPMTPDQIFEQRISFVFGQLEGKVSKDDIRRNLQHLASQPKCPRCGMSVAACRAQAEFPDPEPFL